MTHRELKEVVVRTTGLTKKQVDEYFNVIADVVSETLSKGDRIDLLKMGNLRIRNHQRWMAGELPCEIVFASHKGLKEVMELSDSSIPKAVVSNDTEENMNVISDNSENDRDDATETPMTSGDEE